MAANPAYPSSPLQPKPKVIDNPPATTIAQALNNNANVVNQAKNK
jgi:hypothetical protein